MVSAPSCPNCGAPLPKNGETNCSYCSSPVYVSLHDNLGFLKDDLFEKYKQFYLTDSNGKDIAPQVSLATLYLLDGLPEMAEPIINQLYERAPREPRVILLDCLTILKLNPLRKIKIGLIESTVQKLNVIIQQGSDEEIASAVQITHYINHNYYTRNGILQSRLIKSILSAHASLGDHNESIISEILSRS